MSRYIIITIIALVGYCNADAQVGGTIKAEGTAEVLPYVNIGIRGKGVGTVSDRNGEFEIDLSEKYYSDSLSISMIGYHSQIYLVKNFIDLIHKNSTIHLEENIQVLDEVIISSRRLKKRILGNKAKIRLYSDGFESDQLGSEAGIIIKIKKSPTYVKKFTAYIAKNEHPELKFRLNFYDIKDGLPNKRILKENIIVTSKIKKGKLEVDLEKYNIVVEDDFFVSLEWIEYFGIGELKFAIGFFGSPVIYRYASYDTWEREPPLSPGFNVTVKY